MGSLLDQLQDVEGKHIEVDCATQIQAFLEDGND